MKINSKRLIVVYKVSTPYYTVYEDLSYSDWEYLQKKEEEKNKLIKEILKNE